MASAPHTSHDSSSSTGADQSKSDIDNLLQQLSRIDEGRMEAVSEQTRHRLIMQLRRSAAMLENPFEAMQRIMVSPFTLVAIRVAQGYGIVSRLANARKDGVPCKLQELIALTKIEYGIMLALLDHLISQFIVEETSAEEYIGTVLADQVNTQPMEVSFAAMNDIVMPAWTAMFGCLKEGEERTGWQIGRQTPHSFYTWFEQPENAEAAEKMHAFLFAQFQGIASWLDDIDFTGLYARGAVANDVVFVDVGGGKGQECEKLRKKVPDLTGRVVHQDMSGPLERAPAIDGVEKMAYDYFTEQPLKGARVFYFRQIFHNNDDEKCIEILRKQRPAMSNESKILIDDKVLPDDEQFSKNYTSGLSLNMYSLFKGVERKRRHWIKLLDQAGFEAEDIRVYTTYQDAIITVVPRA